MRARSIYIPCPPSGHAVQPAPWLGNTPIASGGLKAEMYGMLDNVFLPFSNERAAGCQSSQSRALSGCAREDHQNVGAICIPAQPRGPDRLRSGEGFLGPRRAREEEKRLLVDEAWWWFMGLELSNYRST